MVSNVNNQWVLQTHPPDRIIHSTNLTFEDVQVSEDCYNVVMDFPR